MTFNEFISSDYVTLALVVVSAIVNFFLTFIRTGSLKKTINTYLENFMKSKFKTVDDAHLLDYSQSFSEYRPIYILNKSTGLLEVAPNAENIQNLIQSNSDCALEQTLERFLPKADVNVSDVVADYNDCVLDLADIGAVMETADFYREKLNLPDNSSLGDVYSAVDKLAQSFKSSIGKNATIVEGKSEQGGDTSDGKSSQTSSES